MEGFNPNLPKQWNEKYGPGCSITFIIIGIW
jgi:hypothetical protein